MPQSGQEELGKELFDDLLLSLDNMKKLADYMQWSFKFTKVSLLPLLVFVEYLLTRFALYVSGCSQSIFLEVSCFI